MSPLGEVAAAAAAAARNREGLKLLVGVMVQFFNPLIMSNLRNAVIGPLATSVAPRVGLPARVRILLGVSRYTSV